MINIPSHFSFLPLIISSSSLLFVFYVLSSSHFSSPSLISHLLLLSFHLIDTVYKKITRVKEPKKKAESGMFVMKAPTAVVSGSGFAKPTSPTTNDSDSESPTPQPEAFEEPAPEEPPVEEVPTGVRLSPLLSRSAFAECLMCYAVEEEMGSSVSHQCLDVLSTLLCYIMLCNSILFYLHQVDMYYLDSMVHHVICRSL